MLRVSFYLGSVAQLVEQWIEALCVGGSIPSRAITSPRLVGEIIGGRSNMVRKLFPNRRRYTRKGVVAFYNEKRNWVHLIYPDTMDNPFLGGGLMDDSIDKFREETGIAVSSTPVGSRYGLVDDRDKLVDVEEVVL